MTTRIERNIEKMKKAGAPEVEIDQYLIAEKEGENCFPSIWRKPAAVTPALSTTGALALQGRYALEIDGHWRDVIEKARA